MVYTTSGSGCIITTSAWVYFFEKSFSVPKVMPKIFWSVWFVGIYDILSVGLILRFEIENLYVYFFGEESLVTIRLISS
jgi:hypothetical protein